MSSGVELRSKKYPILLYVYLHESFIEIGSAISDVIPRTDRHLNFNQMYFIYDMLQR